MGPKSIIVQRTLYDIRDQKSYTIAKLPDGNCWMTQNLALAPTTSSNVVLTPADSNVSSSFTIPSSAVETGTASWDADTLHVYIQNDSDPDNGAPYGNLYNWYTATAGTGTSSTVSTNATADICPKGWRLPDGGPSTDNSFKSLDIAMGGTGVNRSDDATFRDKYHANPYLFPYSGRYNYNGGLDSQESYGLWWSRSAFTLAGNAYRFTLSSSGAVRPQDAFNVRYGFSVRCIADDSTPGTLTVSPDTIDANTATSVDVSIPLSGDYNANISLGSTALTCSRTSTSPLTYSCNIPSTTSGTYTLTASVPGYGKSYVASLTVESPVILPMQDQASINQCKNAEVGTKFKYQDSRDNNVYTAKKLLDGNCWMTENLKLVGSRTLTSADSDVSADFTLSASDSGNWCTENSSSCDDQSMVLDSEDATYGAYYNWYAATAGTGTYSTTSGNATSSICPKGWRLPTGGSSGEFQTLYGYYSSSADMRSATGPAFVLSGARGGSATGNQGSSGAYWSSTVLSSNHAFDLHLNSSTVSPASINGKFFGLSVRCIAQ